MVLSVTALIGFLDLRNGVFSFVNAGHTLPLLVSDEVSFVKQKNNTVLGKFQNALFDRQEIRLKMGDSIFLYTDGITEAKDADGKIYGDDRLLIFISNMTDRIEAGDRNDYCREACEKILSEVKRYGSGTEQADDITMLWVKYTECRDDEDGLHLKAEEPYDEWYLFYHDSELSGGNNHKRCVKYTRLNIDGEGNIETIKPYD